VIPVAHCCDVCLNAMEPGAPFVTISTRNRAVSVRADICSASCLESFARRALRRPEPRELRAVLGEHSGLG